MARRPGLTTESIVRVAADLVDAEGPDALTLARLAETLGVRAPSLYNHISGLDDLRRRLALYGVRELGLRLTRAAVGKSGEEGAFALAEAYRRFAKERPGVYAMAQRAPGPGESELAAAAEEVLAVIRAVLAPYGLEDEAMVHAMRGLRSLMHGFVSLEQAGGFGIPLDIDESFRFLLRHFLAGLASDQARASAVSGGKRIH